MKKVKAFTLIELLIVIAIIAILVSIVVLSVRNMQDEAKRTKASSELQVLRLALESYYKNTNHYPNPKPEGGDWIDDLVKTVPQIINAKVYDPFNPGQVYRYSLSSGDTSPLAFNPRSRGNSAWAAAVYKPPTPPPGEPPAASETPSPSEPSAPAAPASNYANAKYYIIWSIGSSRDSGMVCSIDGNGKITADERAIWTSNGSLK